MVLATGSLADVEWGVFVICLLVKGQYAYFGWRPVFYGTKYADYGRNYPPRRLDRPISMLLLLLLLLPECFRSIVVFREYLHFPKGNSEDDTSMDGTKKAGDGKQQAALYLG